MDKIIILILPLLWGCTQNDPVPGSTTRPVNSPGATGDWLIPLSEVHDGGPGKDGIPSVDNPVFENVANTSYLVDNDLVLMKKSGNKVKVYPHKILDWHEIVNDQVGEEVVALTYCPLTGSGIGWNRVHDDDTSSFGVSGLLYNSNLLPYDRKTNSTWSQLRLDCVNGELIGNNVEFVTFVETTWGTVKEMYPESLVLSKETGYSRPYGNYPYGDYKVSEQLIFPISNQDNRLHRKERVFSIIDSTFAKVYRFDDFNSGVVLYTDNFRNDNYIVVGSKERNFLVAFLRPHDNVSYTPVQDMGEVIMEDSSGNRWNIFGEAVEGPAIGERLDTPESFIAYWFAPATFYPGVEIFTYLQTD